jgi:hypothetical protein
LLGTIKPDHFCHEIFWAVPKRLVPVISCPLKENAEQVMTASLDELHHDSL